jgi:hypothetical protein
VRGIGGGPNKASVSSTIRCKKTRFMRSKFPCLRFLQGREFPHLCLTFKLAGVCSAPAFENRESLEQPLSWPNQQRPKLGQPPTCWGVSELAMGPQNCEETKIEEILTLAQCNLRFPEASEFQA